MISIEILKNISIFSGLAEEELKRLACVIEEAEYSSNVFVFREGELGSEMFFIKSGAVEVSRTVVADKRKPLTILKPGQFFGEMSLFEDSPRSANILTLESTVLFKLTKKSFESFINLNAAIGIKIYKSLVKELCVRIKVTGDKVQERIFWGFVSKGI